MICVGPFQPNYSNLLLYLKKQQQKQTKQQKQIKQTNNKTSTQTKQKKRNITSKNPKPVYEIFSYFPRLILTEQSGEGEHLGLCTL